MRVLETRHVSNNVHLMTWSPKMDLIALANSKPEIILHRLSWQKVWSLGGNSFEKGGEWSEGNPTSLTFHPEGLYLAVGSDNHIMLVEVETGKIVVVHEVDDLKTVQWRSTNYVPCLEDVFSSETERLESNLSILLAGTKTGKVHIYSGAGLLFTVTLELTSPYPCQVLDIDTTPDFNSTYALSSLSYEATHGNILSLYHFDTPAFASHEDVLGVFAAKAVSYKRYVNAIETQLTGLYENWEKIVEVYRHYMTYGSGKTSDTIVADYIELLMTGIASPEMEMFLGSGGRDKEAKKFITILQTAAGSFNDNLKNIKSRLVFLVREFSEIRGFHRHIQLRHGLKEQQQTEATKILNNVQKLLSLLYHGCIHAEHTAGNFQRAFLHFITLIINTIQTFSVMEAPEVLEEDADPERVFELLNFKVTKNIFEMLNMNPEKESSEEDEEEDSDEDEDTKTVPPVNDLSFLDHIIPPPTEAQLKKFYGSPNIIDVAKFDENEGSSATEWPSFWEFLKEKKVHLDRTFLTKSNESLSEMLVDFPELIREQIQCLLDQPILDNDVIKTNLVLNCFKEAKLELDEFGMFHDQESESVYVFHQQKDENESGQKVWVYRVNDLTTDGPTVTAVLLLFSQNVQAVEFLNKKLLSVLTYNPHLAKDTSLRSGQKESDEAIEVQQGMVSHLELETLFQDLPSRPLKVPQEATEIDHKWTEINVKIPLDVSIPGPIEHDQISQVLPIEGFHPIQMALSGPRRVGALLDPTRKLVQLLDMDLDPPENSCDLDTTTNSTSSTLAEDAKDD